MKAIYKASFLLAFAGFAACKKVENKVYFEGGTAPQLSASTSTVRLEPGEEANQAITFRWTNPDYRFTTGISSQDVNYTLEFDTLGANFGSGAKYATVIARELSKTFTVDELNKVLGNTMLLQLDPRRTYTIEARVISSIGNSVKLTSANKVSFTVRPFPPPPKVQTPSNDEIWVVGGASPGGWNNPLGPAFQASQKFTRRSRTMYDIVIDLNANDGFLILPVMGSWSTKYCINDGDPRNTDGGDFVFRSSGGQDFLSPTPGGRFKITLDFQLGKYRIDRQ